MSDQGPNDPTRAERPVGGDPVEEDPTSVMRPAGTSRTSDTYASETTTRPAAVPPPGAGGVSTGMAIGAALAAGLLGFLLGFLLFGGDDDDDVATDTTTVPVDEGADDELAAERDELAQQVEEQNAQIEDLQSQLDDVTAERDELQSQLDDAGDEEDVTTVPAPDVVGLTVDEAQDIADENGWTLEERAATDAPADAEPGTIVAQSPAEGTPMVEGSVLLVDVVQENADN